MSVDPEEFRADSRAMWEQQAAGWEAGRDGFQSANQPVTDWLVDALGPVEGKTVVELAAGPGDTGLEAARRGARVLITDGAEAMVAVALRRAAELGLSERIQARAMELEWMDLSTATVDAVLCRFGYMLVPDPEAALRETRRILKPGGKLAFAVWDRAEANPWTPGQILLALGHTQPPPPGTPGPFALGDAAALEELVATAGFVDDLRVEGLDFTFTAPDTQTWWDQQRQLSPSMAVVDGMSPAEVYALRDAFDAALAPYTAADGSLAIPARTLMVSASA